MDNIVTSILIEIIVVAFVLYKWVRIQWLFAIEMNEWRNTLWRLMQKKKQQTITLTLHEPFDCNNLMQIWMNQIEFIDHVHDHEMRNIK